MSPEQRAELDAMWREASANVDRCDTLVAAFVRLGFKAEPVNGSDVQLTLTTDEAEHFLEAISERPDLLAIREAPDHV